MEKIKLEITGLSSSQSQIGSFALVLAEQDGNRRLPIIIGGFEAQAIALELEKIKPARPMTHDLFVSVARGYGIELKEVLINNLHEGVFYAKLMLEAKGETQEVDARPSDAVALAVRYQAPIFTSPEILDEAGIVIQDEDEEGAGEDPQETTLEDMLRSQAEGEGEAEGASEQSASQEETDSRKLSPLAKAQRLKQLHKFLEEAINNEDYEKAARLRDQINKLEN